MLDLLKKQGLYNDTGDYHNGANGGLATSEPDSNDSLQDDPQAQPGSNGDADNADQQRSSKQPPEVDAAFAEMRRAKEEAERLRQQLAEYQELGKEYEEYGLRNPRAIAEAVRKQKQVLAEQNQNEDASFSQWLNAEARRFKSEGYDDLQIQTWADAQQAKYDNRKIKRELEQEKQLRAKENDERKKSDSIEQGKKAIMDEYRELRKDYPDLLPAGSKSFDDLASKLDPKIIDKMMRGMSFEDAFHVVNVRKIARRIVDRDSQKDKDNADRSTSSGRAKGDAMGGTYGLTPRQQNLAKDGGMTNKEYAALLQHVKK